MRGTKSSGLLILGLLISACGGETSEVKPAVAPAPPPAETAPAPIASAPAETPPAAPVEPKKTPAEQQLATLKASFEGWNAGDAKKVAGTYAENATFVQSGMPEVKGRDAIQAHVQKNMDAFPKAKYAVWRSWQKGDILVAEWVVNGTHTGEFLGLKGTEKPVGVHGASITWMTPEGLIKEQHDYFDAGTVMSQVGASKQPARAIPALPASAENHAAKGTPDEDKNVEQLKTFYTAMEKKSEADFLAAMTDSTEYEDFSQPQTFKGKSDAKKFFGTFTKAFPDLKQSANTVFGVEDYVVAETTMTGTQKGPLGPIPATKKPVTLKSIDILQYKDGKLVKGWTYANGADMMMQLGVLKAPAAAKTDGKGADAKAQQGKPAAAAKGEAPKGADSKPAPKADAKPAAAPAPKADKPK